jgi:hypothetical protein
VSLGAVAAIGVAAAVAPLLWTGANGGGGAAPGSWRTLPALVAAGASTDPTIGTLVLAPQPGSGLAAGIERGAGGTLEEQSTLYSAASASRALGPDIAALAGNLASRSGYDPVPMLGKERIGFVLLAPAGREARAVHDRAAAALDANPLFAPVTSTSAGTLWRYTGLDAGLPAPAPTGPGNLDTTVGAGILGVQLLVLLVTLLLALPTGGLADRVRPEREARRAGGLLAPRRSPSAVRATPTLAFGGSHGE